MKKILKSLKKEFGYTSIERCLQLPFGTLKKFEKSKRIPADAQALLRIIYTCPFMLEVADNNYSQKASDEILLNEATSLVIQTKYKDSK